MSKKVIDTFLDIDTSDKLSSILDTLITNNQCIQYIYLNGDGPVTLKLEQVEETLSDGSKVQDIYITTQEDEVQTDDEKVAEHIAKNAQLLGGLI